MTYPNYTDPEAVAAAEAAMRQGMADARERMTFYEQHTGVTAGTSGEENRPVALPGNRATDGTHAAGGA